MTTRDLIACTVAAALVSVGSFGLGVLFGAASVLDLQSLVELRALRSCQSEGAD